MHRRDFMKSVASASVIASSEVNVAGTSATRIDASASGPVFISTWTHGKPANERAAEVFKSGRSLLDAVEQGINVPENDPAVTSVGYGGLPNAEGVVELDAAIMDGARHRAGAVCSLHSIKNAISVARLVLEKTRHTTLAGEGAFRFALQMGFEPQQLLTPESLQAWLKWKNTPLHETFWFSTTEVHDTIGMAATDGNGHMVAGCSSSGLPWKIPGRVGDSPLVGCGVYAEDHAGAASATGDGDLLTNYCTSISIVRSMAQGVPPQDACVDVLHHMAQVDPRNRSGRCCVIAVGRHEGVGAASMHSDYLLKYALWKDGESQLLEAVALY
jgi:isoaspartyl peptidase/L-asparaginase-like protein (Ntn-hydrolase superfamily)